MFRQKEQSDANAQGTELDLGLAIVLGVCLGFLVNTLFFSSQYYGLSMGIGLNFGILAHLFSAWQHQKPNAGKAVTISAAAIIVSVIVLMVATPATAQGTDPVEIVESFYTWYLDYTGYDEATETFNNPLVDGSFRQRTELSPELIAAVDAQQERFADPFLCAQDVPERATFAAVDEASVLVNLHFGQNPHPHSLVVELDEGGLIADVDCMETFTAEGTVRAFYTTYIEDRDAAEVGSNPLLTDTLNASLSETFANGIPLGEGDPVVCAQDRPAHQAINLMVADEETATVMVRAFFANNPTPRLITADLLMGDRWQIDAITCGAAPEIIAAYLYNEFALIMRYDLENGIARTPLADWSPYPWMNFMDEALYTGLVEAYSSGDPRPADPFLCAQDIPAQIEATVVPGPQSNSLDVQISGLYPSGPDSYDSYDLALVTLAPGEDGIWRMIEITCTP